VGEALASTVKKIATQNEVTLNSDEDVARFAWNHYNGTNKIGQVNGDHMVLSVVKRQDLGMDLRQPSIGKFPGLGASCREGAVVYKPTPTELLKREGALLFFKLEIIVRFNSQMGGPATPLVLIGHCMVLPKSWTGGLEGD
jgi:hypothetical protein